MNENPAHTLPQVNIPPGMIHLGIGQPSPDLLPLKELQTAADHAMSKNDPGFLAYGAEKGDPGFRQTLAGFLSPELQTPADLEDLLITNGNSQALDFICTLFSKPGDTILVEEPSYFLALKIFRDHHLNLISVPVDAHGVIIDALEEKAAVHNPVFFYTIPTFHNPAGVTLSLERRKKLAQICSARQLLIVADEVYHFLDYNDTGPVPMASFKEDCPLISLGSFSKILAPGLRLGWMHTNRALADRMAGAGLLESGGGLNPFTSQIVNSMISLGLLHQHIRELKSVYAKRMEALYSALRTHLSPLAEFRNPGGGYFIWVCFPENIDTKTLREKARKKNIDYNAGSLFSATHSLENAIRLSFSFYDKEDLIKGVKRLAGLF